MPVANATLRSALEHADLRVLLMALFHRTGDRRWLEAPYLPKRDVRLIAEEYAGFPESIRVEILTAAEEAFADLDAPPSITDPGDELMIRMMSSCLGEQVPDEYAPLIREELGFASRDMRWSQGASPKTSKSRKVLIVGAGVSGIALGARLERLGVPYSIVERHPQLGGTWYENRYPGCGVDTPNHAYSFSIGTRYRWRRFFSARDQLFDYLVRCADEFGVRPHIRLETSLTRATWNEEEGRWFYTLETPEGTEEGVADFLVSAIGQFGLPSIPEIEGASEFEGEIFHSAHWPDDLDLAGKRVALVGTGATSMQIAPTIADRVASLEIYQRSPQWARPIPRYHDDIPDEAQWLLENLPFYAEWFRFTLFWRYGDGLLRFLRKDPTWKDPARSLNKVNDRHRQEMTEHIERELAGRDDLIEACVPDYPPYGKRILLDNGWFQTLRKPNVELINDAVGRIDANGIQTSDGRHRPADVVVYATGFQMTQMTSRLNIKGRAGLDLGEAWDEDNPTAHLGMTVPGFPNLFLMLGPNTGLGHGGSAIFLSECQARYITSLIVQMIEGEDQSAEVKSLVHDEYNARVDAEHEELIWTHPGMETYYRNGRGRVFSVMPWRLVDYWGMTRDATLDEFERQALPGPREEGS
ncbi:MAG: NAD(P)/FAD-dependent oxidoreductase [Myxococcota bacterium]|nr:NAD(P)/FAD-dependent oxidoreductase [Myxococcota bacterium]